jgi:uncharacterized membrane protein
MIESHQRSIAKALSWRIIATLCTCSAAWIITGSMDATIKVGCLDFIAKLIIYYTHERFWQKIKWGCPTGIIERGEGI